MNKRRNKYFALPAALLLVSLPGLPGFADSLDPGAASLPPKGLSIETQSGTDVSTETLTGTGQSVPNANEGGGVFMEELVDPQQQAREAQQLKTPVKLNRRALTPEELSNVGVQMEPSGRIVPLLNPNATSPVQQYGTQMSTYTEFPYGIMVPNQYGNPYMNGGVPYGAPYPVPYPYAPGVNIGVGTPITVSGSNNSTVSPAANGGVQFGNSGKFVTGPSLQGGMNISPYGGITGGARIGLPTVTEYESTTTVTPILPPLPPPTAPDAN